MKKITYVFALLTLVAALMLSAAAVNIGSAEELVALMNDPTKWDGDFTLTADIDLTDKPQSPIGDYKTPFTGQFDGNGHTITLDIITTAPLAGLFGAAENAYIENLTVSGSVLCTYGATSAESKADGRYSATGAVLGIALEGTTVSNCTNRAKVIGPCNLGGVVGMIENKGTAPVYVTNCANHGIAAAVYGNMGGVVGRISLNTTASPAASVKNCANYADIHYTSEDRARMGGVVGYIRTDVGVAYVENCRNEGNLSAKNNTTASQHYPTVGGICSRIEIQSNAEAGTHIVACYNSGTVSSSKYAASIAAYIGSGTAANKYVLVSDCVNVGAVSAGSYGGMVAYMDCSARATVKNCLNTAPLESITAGGGIVGRLRGADVRHCVSLGKIGIVAVSAGDVACEIKGNFYADTGVQAIGKTVAAVADGGNTAFAAAAARAKETFAGLDFDAWVMGEKCPVPKALASVEIEIPTKAAPAMVEGLGDDEMNGDPTAVFHDSGATNDNDGLTPATPKKDLGTLSTHLYLLLQRGGTVVCVGNTEIAKNYTFARTAGPVTFTAVFDGVDYKTASDKGCFTVGGITLTVCSDVILDGVRLVTAPQSTLCITEGGTLTVTDRTVLSAGTHGKLVIEAGGTAVLSEAARAAFTIENKGGTLLEYVGGETELRLTIGQKTAYVNGEPKALDAAPLIKSGRTMLPVRFVAENLGGTVGWDGASSSVTVKGDGIDIAIKVGAATASINGKTVTLDAPAFIESGRTYLPVRVVAEAMGATVVWDGATSTATLTK